MADLNVLIVDDDAGDRKHIRRLLKQAQVPAAEAESGQMALDIEDQKINAILLDHLLPGESGLEVLLRLRRKWPRAGIVLMTGQGSEEIAKSAIKRGANDYVAKANITEGSLIRMLTTALDVATMQWKLDEHRRDLETFSDVLIHDLRSPIRGAIFLSEEICEAIADGDLDAARDSAMLMRKAAGQLAEFVDSLSTLARIDHDESPVLHKAEDFVDRALTALAREIEESAARIEIDLDLPAILCRPVQMAQLLQNLVANAIKFSGSDPPHIRISGRAAGHTVEMTVRDHGIGVPAKYRSSIFEPFKRLPSASKVAGTGLGLTTCRKVVTRHGGQIWCDPAVTRGTAICFTLPDAIPAARPPAPQAADCHSPAPGPVRPDLRS